MPHKSMGVMWPLFQEPSRKLRVKGFRRMQGNIRPLAKPIVEAVPELVKRIQYDKFNFDTPDALENEVLEIMRATINDDFRSNSYPRIKPTKDNLRKYGITSRHPRIAFIQVLISTVKDTFKAIISRNIKDAAITEKWARLTSGQIARKYGYNKEKRRIKESERKYYNVETGKLITGAEYKSLKGQEKDFYRCAPAVSDDNFYRLAPKESQDVQGLPDNATVAFTDQIENELLFQQLSAIKDTADKLVICTQLLAIQSHISFEAAYQQNQGRFHKVGIHSPRAAKKRLRYTPNKYPELKVIRESLKR